MNKKKGELLPFWFPESKRDKLWTVVFITLFALSIDFWNWNSDARIYDWIPIWIIYLIAIQFTLAYSLWRFSKEWNVNE